MRIRGRFQLLFPDPLRRLLWQMRTAPFLDLKLGITQRRLKVTPAAIRRIRTLARVHLSRVAKRGKHSLRCCRKAHNPERRRHCLSTESVHPVATLLAKCHRLPKSALC